jgi:hypothetical protein
MGGMRDGGECVWDDKSGGDLNSEVIRDGLWSDRCVYMHGEG